MRALRAFAMRLLGLVRRERDDARIAEEMRFHLDRLTERFTREGFLPDEARRRAALTFGGLPSHQEHSRETMRNRLIEDCGRDVRHALRGFRKNPAFTAMAILTLALGIGATTVIYGIVYATLIRPLPYEHPERLAVAFETNKRGQLVLTSAPDVLDWQQQVRSFAHLVPYFQGQANVVIAGEPARVRIARVATDFVAALGAKPIVGAGFPDDQHAVLISERLWRGQFGSADLSKIAISSSDRALAIGAASPVTFAVAGVLPASFNFPRGTDVWAPMNFERDANGTRSAHNYRLIGDLKPGVSIAAATADLKAVAARLAGQYPSSNDGIGATLIGLQDALTQNVRPTLLLLMLTVGLVLLLACTNVANLLLARGTARRGEMVTRMALGAGTGRLVRQLITESIVLGLLGALSGVALALVAAGPVRALPVVASLPVPPDFGDWRVLGFSAVLTLATVLLFGIMPALRTAAASRGGLASARRGIRTGLRATMLAGEVALAALLLVGAALTTRSLVQLQRQELGFSSTNVALLELSPDPLVQPALLDRVRAIPGVIAAAYTGDLPFDGGTNGSFLVEGERLVMDNTTHAANWRTVSDGYFATLGIPIVRGREFLASDQVGPGVALVNQAMARAYWPGSDPVGQRIAIPGFATREFQAHQAGRELWYTIVGVVGDVRDVDPTLPPAPTLYLTTRQHQERSGGILVRSPLPLDQLATSLIAAGKAFSPSAPVRLRPLRASIDGTAVQPRFRSTLIGLFAALALVLAAIGIYGVSAYVTSQRTQEIGLRIAIGARASQVVAGIVRRVALHASIGLVVGLAAAVMASRFIKTMLYGVPPTDVVSFAVVGGILLGVTIVAAYLPARRAARVDPMAALRVE